MEIPTAPIQQADRLHQASIIIDGLNVSAWDRPVLESIRAGGTTAINATAACWENFRETIKNIAGWQQRFADYPDLLLPVFRASDIAEAKRTGRLGVILGFQNASPIEDELDFLGIFHALGVRRFRP